MAVRRGGELISDGGELVSKRGGVIRAILHEPLQVTISQRSLKRKGKNGSLASKKIIIRWLLEVFCCKIQAEKN